MPFKLTVIVENSLSLGSILITGGVHVIHIDTITKREVKEEPIQDTLKLLPKHINKQINQSKFKHPLGRTSGDFVMEYLEQHKMGKWADLREFVSKQGFAKSSINNGIARLIKMGKIRRTGPGLYVISLVKKVSE